MELCMPIMEWVIEGDVQDNRKASAVGLLLKSMLSHIQVVCSFLLNTHLFGVREDTVNLYLQYM